jgi:hypothetical protein
MGDVVDRRVHRNFGLIAEWCAPRVLAAYFRTIWNGWATDRRLNSLRDTVRSCILGCEAEDSLEHYCCCPAFWKFAIRSRPRGLGLRPELRSKSTFFLTREGLHYKDTVRVAVGIYSLQRVVCCMRHGESQGSVDNLLYLWAKRGSNNTKASQLLKFGS